MTVRAPKPIPADALRWRCDAECLGFASTESVEPVEGVVGQDSAVEALRFGLEIDAPGQNIFVRGLAGTGRLTLVRELLERVTPASGPAPDRCYVHNFTERDRPRLISLPQGDGEIFRDRVGELIGFITDHMAEALDSDDLESTRRQVDEAANAALENITGPLEAELAQAGLALMLARVGQATRPVIVPVLDGKPTPPAQLEKMRKAGTLDDEALEAMAKKADSFRGQMDTVGKAVAEIQRTRRNTLRSHVQDEAKALLVQETTDITTRWPDAAVQRFIAGLIDDVVAHHVPSIDEDADIERTYQVNLLLRHDPGQACPKIVENAPSVQSLLGSINAEYKGGGPPVADHLSIHAGSLLRADGGYLIIDARDLLTEPGAWRVLIRTLRSGSLDYTPPESPTPWRAPSLKPEPVPINLKVILLGDASIYYMLDGRDGDFPELFKVLADFDSTIGRDEGGLRLYAAVVSRLVAQESLPHFSASAIAALAEHGARIAARQTRLTARFARVADIAREAAFLARKRPEGGLVEGTDVVTAVRRTKTRANLPARRFLDSVRRGSLRIATRGEAVGEVNGLAVISAGPLTYGFPSRITATAGPGSQGAINIEREADLSGAIHTKGFYILGGLLRHLLRNEHPLVFDASIAFEQSYGGIDGDSASGAEICCLLSALTGVALRQDRAMTGAIDQHGNILPIGAVNEKIEGFFDVCSLDGLTGKQGVIVPAANTGDLMLRHDVVQACREGKFHVWAVERIEQALELFTDMEAGTLDEAGEYPEGTLLHTAVERVDRFWEMAHKP